MIKVNDADIIQVREHPKKKQVIYVDGRDTSYGGKVILPNGDRKMFLDISLLALVNQIIQTLGGVRDDYYLEWSAPGLLNRAGEKEDE